jgi:hypothetical protein
MRYSRFVYLLSAIVFATIPVLFLCVARVARAATVEKMAATRQTLPVVLLSALVVVACLAILLFVRGVWIGRLGSRMIRVENELFRERLFVDGVLVATHSGVGFGGVLSGDVDHESETIRIRAKLGTEVSYVRVACLLLVGERRIDAIEQRMEWVVPDGA